MGCISLLEEYEEDELLSPRCSSSGGLRGWPLVASRSLLL
eukprot:CAMPEP_0206631734 /NCGR_PEP_ID=MMETSP0325_2-20121206/68435_1 /ASSEMBLY_ACC=CAM_ASM_000347 /TAXON_ID=2866 /ORGANISM="Crypthecodinium cohnii, Strain Seligo" /LENGTH=39 /DNA_ID= /DNA_START= /DNA_END= /DNA_ORIENTATION=